jgi:hypothetical protein
MPDEQAEPDTEQDDTGRQAKRYNSAGRDRYYGGFEKAHREPDSKH